MLPIIHSTYGSFLLPQAFPEGSPTHPCDPTGHGAVGGACITLRGATVTYTYSFIALGGIIKLLPGGSGFITKTLTATALMRYEGPAAAC